MSVFPNRGSVPRPPYLPLLIVLVSCGALMAGCGSGDLPLSEADPSAVPDTTGWTQVNSIVQRECTPCHGPNGKEPRYDRCEDVVANFSDLYEQVFELNEMPPGAWPRLTSEEKLVLTRWSGDAPCQ